MDAYILFAFISSHDLLSHLALLVPFQRLTHVDFPLLSEAQ